MAETYILNKINDKPGAFFKKLSPYWYYQLTYSVTFREWAEDGEQWRVDDIKEAAKGKPAIAGEIANIVNCLEDEYPDTDYDYKNHTYVTLAILLHKKYKERILAYFEKKKHPVLQGNLSYHPNQQDAWKELVLRGFVPEFFKLHEGNKYFLKATIGNLVLINTAKDAREAMQEQAEWGVMGYTGFNQPKS